MIKDRLRFFRLKAFLLILFSFISLFTLNSYAEINEDLRQAAAEGNTLKVAELISAGADVNAKSKVGWTALIRAAFKGHTETVKLLLAKGADVNGRGGDSSWTALMVASGHGHIETMKLLLSKGADVNAKDKDGWTALIRAVIFGSTEAVKLLLGKGADVTVKDKDGQTALSWATFMWTDSGHSEIIQLLKQAGARE